MRILPTTHPWTPGCNKTPALPATPRSPARWVRRRITTAVVDQYCNVHGLQNLRVIDASVMPDIVRANTNATIIMMAERAADFIKDSN